MTALAMPAAVMPAAVMPAAVMPAAVMPAAAMPRRPLCRVPSPATEPSSGPFDSSQASQGWQAEEHPVLVPFAPGRPQDRPGARLRLVTDAESPRPTGGAGLPDPRAWARRLVTAVQEVEAGARPPAQLARYLRDDVYAGVRRRAQRGRGAGPPSRVRRVRICEPDDGIVEATVLVERGGRCAAVALRLEGIDGRWVCTVLDTLVPAAGAPISLGSAS